MNQKNFLQKHTLLPPADEQALSAMLEMFQLLDEISPDGAETESDFSPLRPDIPQEMIAPNQLSSHFSVFSPDGIELPCILPPKEENDHDRA